MAELLRRKIGIGETPKAIKKLIEKTRVEAMKKEACELRAKLRGLEEGSLEHQIFVIGCLEEEI